VSPVAVLPAAVSLRGVSVGAGRCSSRSRCGSYANADRYAHAASSAVWAVTGTEVEHTIGERSDETSLPCAWASGQQRLEATMSATQTAQLMNGASPANRLVEEAAAKAAEISRRGGTSP
jgi:hypothetical protein